MRKDILSQNITKLVKGCAIIAIAGAVTAIAGAVTTQACTSYYAGKDTTTDGSILFGRTEDISSAYDKTFSVVPAANHATGDVFDDGTGFTMPYPSKTYRYTACYDDPENNDGLSLFAEAGTNQYGVSMSATESASCSDAAYDADPYVEGTGITEASMVSAVLPCVKTAKEGVKYLADIIDTYGAGEGNTLMIGDKDEVWYIEILTGHQYVAVKMPSDKTAILPNCFMLQGVDVTDTDNVIASAGLTSTVEDAGLLVKDETGLINIRESYADTMEEGNTYRVWGGQIILAPSLAGSTTPTDTDPDTFITPDSKVSVKTMYKIAGTRYEGTEYAETGRAIGVSASVECHIFQVRSDMPTELGTLEWLCMGSADLSTFVPFYSAAITDTHKSYQVADPVYNSVSAYWTFRSLATLSATSRTYIAPAVKAYWGEYMDALIAAQDVVDTKMEALYKQDPDAVAAKATDLGKAVADEALNKADSLYSEVMYWVARYDGNVSKAFTAPADTTTSYSYDLVYASDVSVASVPGKVKGVSLTAAKKSVSVSFNKVTGADKYKITYSTSKTFVSAKTVTVTANKKTIKKLMSGKKYYVKVAAGCKVDGKYVYGKYSAVKSVKTK